MLTLPLKHIIFSSGQFADVFFVVLFFMEQTSSKLGQPQVEMRPSLTLIREKSTECSLIAAFISVLP